MKAYPHWDVSRDTMLESIRKGKALITGLHYFWPVRDLTSILLLRLSPRFFPIWWSNEDANSLCPSTFEVILFSLEDYRCFGGSLHKLAFLLPHGVLISPFPNWC